MTGHDTGESISDVVQMRVTVERIAGSQGKPPDCVGGIPTTQSWGFMQYTVLPKEEIS